MIVGQTALFPKKVLVVEDDRTFQWLLRKELTEMGFLVDCCSDSKTANRISTERPFDVFILDCGVFFGKAGTFVRSLRQRYPAALIIGVSGYYEGTDFIESGADHFLDKPLEFERLLGLLTSRTV